jgi:hypothetical protein
MPTEKHTFRRGRLEMAVDYLEVFKNSLLHTTPMKMIDMCMVIEKRHTDDRQIKDRQFREIYQYSLIIAFLNKNNEIIIIENKDKLNNQI